MQTLPLEKKRMNVKSRLVKKENIPFVTLEKGAQTQIKNVLVDETTSTEYFTP